MADKSTPTVKLTEEDRKAIADHLWARMKKDLYMNTGKGVIHAMIRLSIIFLLLFAAYGYHKGWINL